MKKLDWARLLGFEQIANDRDESVSTRRISGKVGDKSGVKNM